MTGAQVAANAGNRAPADPCVDTQGDYPAISNNG